MPNGKVFYRPESFKSTKLTSSLVDGGSESTFTVPDATTGTETKGWATIKQGSGNDARREIIEFTNRSTGTYTINERGLAENQTTGTALPTTGVAANKKRFSVGATMEISNNHYYLGQIVDWGNGLTGSGATELKVGLDTDVDIKLTAANSDANEPFLMYDASENAWVFSDDGVTTTKMVTGGSGLTAGDGIDITASVINVDLATDPALEFDGGSPEKLRVKVKANSNITRDSDGISFDGTDNITITGQWQFSDIRLNEAVQLTATSTEINQALDGISANVTDTNLNILNGGPTSDASQLHEHPIAHGQATQAINTTGTQNIAHGLGVTPRFIQVFANAHVNALNTEAASSVGTATSASDEKCQFRTPGPAGAGGGQNQDTTHIIVLSESAVGSAASAQLTGLDATNITLNWDVNKNQGSVRLIQWIAYA